ncbi:MAG TPA: hypothetical protein PLL98_09785 [Bacillota bacterium]|nr:hypothetical protein [Bacillota bacterium]HOR86762.1 hypothetical protein [Bacillota bacterium]HPL54075.1 hypothetical protein [Bacillota bacterium]
MSKETGSNTVKEKLLLLLLFLLVGFTAYWFGNAVLWIPWVINMWLGITIMIILVPFLWGYASLYCLKFVSKKCRKNKNWLMAIAFLVVSVISDYFFFAVWRGIPDQLYHPTTLAAYGLIFIMPFLVNFIFEKRRTAEANDISVTNLIIIAALGITLLFITLYCVRFW